MKALRGPFQHSVDYALTGVNRGLGKRRGERVDACIVIGMRVRDEDSAQTLTALPYVLQELLHIAFDESAIHQKSVLAAGHQHRVGRQEAFLAREHVKS